MHNFVPRGSWNYFSLANYFYLTSSFSLEPFIINSWKLKCLLTSNNSASYGYLVASFDAQESN